MLPTNQWRTPKGFYKHFYLGQSFKEQKDINTKQWQKHKDAEINRNFYIQEEQKDLRLIQLEAKMLEKNTAINMLAKSLYQESSEEVILQIRDSIQTLRQELENLWDKQLLIEQENENIRPQDSRLCA